VLLLFGRHRRIVLWKIKALHVMMCSSSRKVENGLVCVGTAWQAGLCLKCSDNVVNEWELQFF
jgi:hypothetical protein